MRCLIYVFFGLFSLVLSAQPYYNEWIDFSKTYYKFYVEEDGMYRIPYSAIADAGLPLDAPGFQLFNKGEQIPIYVSTDGTLGTDDYIEFYGEQNDGEFDTPLFESPDDHLKPDFSLFTSKNAYFLTQDNNTPNLRYTDIPNNADSSMTPEPYFWHTSIANINNVFHNGNFEFYVDTIAYSRFYSGFSKGLGFVSLSTTNGQIVKTLLPSAHPYLLDNLSAEIRARVIGREYWLTADDANLVNKHYQILLNDSIYVDALNVQTDFQDHTFNISILELNTALPDKTLIELATVNDFLNEDKNNHNASSLANIEITYPRLFDLDDLYEFKLSLQITQEKYIELQNFNGGDNPILYNIETLERMPLLFDGIVHQALLPFSSAAQIEQEIVVVNTDSIPVITELQTVNFINYDLPENQGDYIILSHPWLMEAGNPVQQYADYRSSEAGGNYNIVIIDINQLYDQFSWGIEKHPLSIRHFVDLAFGTWTEEPSYLNLIGKGITFNQTLYNETNFDNSLVPSYGYIASDINLVAKSTIDYRPRMAVGRIPASTPNEVQVYLNKVIEHENYNTTNCSLEDRLWKKRELFVVKGWSPTQTNNFEDSLNLYRSYIEDVLGGVQIMNTLKDSIYKNYSSNNAIKPYFENGLGIVHHYGWGSQPGGNPSYWQFDIKHPEYYNWQERYPIFIETNSTGSHIFFSGGGGDGSMPMNYLFEPEGGSIAHIRSNHIFYFLHASHLHRDALTRNIYADNYGGTLGESLKNTAHEIYDSNLPLTKFLSLSYHLIGDPAIKAHPWKNPEWHLTNGSVSFTPFFTESEGSDSLLVFFQIVDLGLGTNDLIPVEIEVLAPDGSLFVTWQTEVLIDDLYNNYQITFPTDDFIINGAYTLNVMVNPDQTWEEDCYNNNQQSNSVLVTGVCQPLEITIENLETTYCQNDDAFVLEGSQAIGTFKIDGQPTTFFTPASLSIGLHTATYHYTNPDDLCAYASFQTVEILNAPNVELQDLETAYCSDQSIEIDFGGIAQNGATFLYDFGEDADPPTANTSEPHSITYSSAGTKTINLIVNNPNGCSASTSMDIEIGTPLETPALVCGEASVNQIALGWEDIEGAEAYLYFLNDSPIPSIAGGSGSTFTVINGLEPDTDYTIEFFADGSGICGDSETFVLECTTLSCGQMLSASSSINDTYCTNTPTSIITFEPEGGIINSLSLVNGNELDPTLLAAGQHNVSYTLTDETGLCEIEFEFPFEILLAPSAELQSTNTEYCITETVQIDFGGTAENDATFLYNFGEDANPPTASTAGPHNIIYSSAGTKTLGLIVNNPNGCNASTSMDIEIEAPLATPALVCEASISSLILNWETVPNADSYFYTLDDGLPILAGNADDITLLISNLEPDTEHEISFYAEATANMCSMQSPIVSISCSTEECPNLTFTSNLREVHCTNEGSINVIVEPAGGILSGQYLQGDNSIDPSQIPAGTTIELNYQYLIEGGVCVYNVPITFEVLETELLNNIPDYIEAPNPIQFLDAGNEGATYLWSNGSTHHSTYVTETGWHWVEITDTTDGCSITSNVYVDFVTDVHQLKQTLVNIYPNPFTNQLMIEIEESGVYQLYSIQGKLLQSGRIEHGRQALDVQPVPAGIYIIQIASEVGMYIQKLVKE